jgi:hypothetical protein
MEKSIKVKLYSIDDFVETEKIEKADFIKIDAEGAELKVLKGAGKTISRFHPEIILALHPKSISNFGDSLSEIWSLVTAMEYTVSLNGKNMSENEFCSKENLFDVFLQKK